MSLLLTPREQLVIRTLHKCESVKLLKKVGNVWTLFEAKAAATAQASGSKEQ